MLLNGNSEAALSVYKRFEFTAKGYTRPVYMRGVGPAVVICHEIPGLHPGVIAFADRVAEAGMSVYLPVLFGEPGRPVDDAYLRKTMFDVFCVRREFTVWRIGRSSPIVEFLRALARHAHETAGGRGVGAVGMCFTGGFALAMMTEPAVVAPVLAQPSLPLGIGAKRAAAIDLSTQEIACVRRRFEAEDLSALALRFAGDGKSPRARFDRLAQTFPGRVETIELKDADAAPSPYPPHSTLTVHLAESGPTKEAEQKVIAFLKARTASAP